MTADAKLEVHLEGLELYHPAAQAAAGELLTDLRRASDLPVEEREVNDGDGTKGALVELIVSLGTPGSIVGLARIMQLWLGRDRRRSIRVSVRNGDEETVIDVEGDQISTDTLAHALRSAVERNQEPGQEKDSETH